MLQEFVDAQVDIPCDLTKQRRGDVAAGMERNGRAATVTMAVLAVGAALAYEQEIEILKDAADFFGLENRDVTHAQAMTRV
jgi:hypothetical protein